MAKCCLQETVRSASSSRTDRELRLFRNVFWVSLRGYEEMTEILRTWLSCALLGDVVALCGLRHRELHWIVVTERSRQPACMQYVLHSTPEHAASAIGTLIIAAGARVCRYSMQHNGRGRARKLGSHEGLHFA